MPYEYLWSDNFWDIESLKDLFTIAFYYPKRNVMILSYLDDKGIIDPNNKDQIDKIIKKRNPNFNGRVILEDLSKIGSKKEPKSEAELGLRTLYRRVGFTMNVYETSKKKDRFGNEKISFYSKKDVSQVINGDIKHREVKDDKGKTIVPAQYYPVKDTDPEYNPKKDGLFFGYNTTQYDLTILAHYLGMQDVQTILNSDAHPNTAVKNIVDNNMEKVFTARNLREFNDELFSSDYKKNMPSRLLHDYEPSSQGDYTYNKFGKKELSKRYSTPSWDLRQAWLFTGRFIDVAALNEKMFRVGLKRLLGMLGYQILEFEGLDEGVIPEDPDEIKRIFGSYKTQEEIGHELIAYNLSDVVNLQHLFENKFYQNNFNLKRQLLKDYPETIYDKHPEEYRANYTGDPNKDYKNVSFKRLRIDSTSAKFIEKVIAPYNQMVDKPVVDFMYPSKEEAERLSKETGRDIQPSDVLEDTKKWFEKHTAKPGTKAHDDFMEIYNFYDGIRGRNFNESDFYQNTYINEIQDDMDLIAKNTEFRPKYEQTLNTLKNFENESSASKHRFIEETQEADVMEALYEDEKVNIDKVYSGFYESDKRQLIIDKLEQAIKEIDKRGDRYIHEVKDNTYTKALMKKFNTNLFYFKKSDDLDPEYSSCIANFSIGGIHGAEVDLDTFGEQMDEWRKKQRELEYVVNMFDGDAHKAINGDVRITNIYGEKQKIRDYMKSGSTKKEAKWRVLAKPTLWRTDNGQKKLHGKYTHVSVGKSFHEDFASYYPLLLTRMSVFRNEQWGQGVDPYFALFEKRFEMKMRAKDKSLSQEERDQANIIQNAMKLLLNAATGAADASFDNNIRMNNAIISMRIIGQLFAWRIGQAQTLAGARVPSTNTDGLYTMDLDEETNARTLEETVQDMHIEIDPEPLDRFVSKDSNNRLEILNDEIVDSKGGTLNSYEGPTPTQSLDHPSAVDRALAFYLKEHPDPANSPFDEDLAKQMFGRIVEENKHQPQETLRHFQWILSSSSGTIRYIFMQNKNVHTGEIENQTVQQYNRVFLTKPKGNTIKTPFLAIRKTITPAMAKNRKKLKEPMQQHDKQARKILLDYNVDFNEFESKHESGIQKAKNMTIEQNVTIYNRSLYDLSEKECKELIRNLDVDEYIRLLKNTLENSWSNVA